MHNALVGEVVLVHEEGLPALEKSHASAAQARPMDGMRLQAHDYAAGDVVSATVRRHHPRTLFTTAPGKLPSLRAFRAANKRCKVAAASVEPRAQSFPAPHRQGAGVGATFAYDVHRATRNANRVAPAPSPFVPLADVRLVDDPEGGVWACTKVAAALGGPPREPARQPPPSPTAHESDNQVDEHGPPDASEDDHGLDARQSTPRSVSLQADSVHGLDDLVTDLRVEDLVEGVI